MVGVLDDIWLGNYGAGSAYAAPRGEAAAAAFPAVLAEALHSDLADMAYFLASRLHPGSARAANSHSSRIFWDNSHGPSRSDLLVPAADAGG